MDMARAEQMTFLEFQTKFGTEEECRAYLYKQRFPNGFICPSCGCNHAYEIRTRKLFQCKDCRKQVSVTSGTVMHRTHLPLTVWFWAIYLCVNDKRGVSALQLCKMLQISYESSWYLLARIRRAMGQRDEQYKLGGFVEMDDAYLGGTVHGGKRGRGTTRDKMVVALSIFDEKPQYLRLKLVNDLKNETLSAFAKEYLDSGAIISADGHRSYQNIDGFSTIQQNFSPDGDHLLWLHKTISNLKAFLLGTYHGRCEHIQSYLDEFAFRFNRRFFEKELFSRLTRAVALSCALLS